MNKYQEALDYFNTDSQLEGQIGKDINYFKSFYKNLLASHGRFSGNSSTGLNKCFHCQFFPLFLNSWLLLCHIALCQLG